MVCALLPVCQGDYVYLFFDTETTGLPKHRNAPVSDLKNWPRLVQIAWLVADDKGTEIACAEQIVKPRGFTIPADAARIHGITTERALQQGKELISVLDAIVKDINRSSVLISHNIEFDEKVLGAELLRARYPNCLATKERRCTKQLATDFCQLPGQYGYKWPTLPELYMKLFNKKLEEAHRALADVRICAECYYELKRRRIID